MTVKQFLIQLALMALVVILTARRGDAYGCVFIQIMGKSLNLPDYKEMHISEAEADANDKKHLK